MKYKVKTLYFKINSVLDVVPKEDIELPDNAIPIGSKVEDLYTGSGKNMSDRYFCITILEPVMVNCEVK